MKLPARKPGGSTQPDSRKSHARSRVSNGRTSFPTSTVAAYCASLPGYRTAVVVDQGGAAHCSESRTQLIRRFAAAAVLAEQMESKLANGEEINIQDHALLCSTLVQGRTAYRNRPARAHDRAGSQGLSRRTRDGGCSRMRRPRITLLDAMADANLFASWFRDPTSWAAWRAFLKSLFALSMNDAEFAIYQECTGRTVPPSTPATEAWLVCGRRSGKSFVLALVAVLPGMFSRLQPLSHARRARHRHDCRRRSKTKSRHFEIHPWSVDWRADAQAHDRARDGGGLRSLQ